MFRGTTPTNTFNVQIDLTSATKLYVTYVQNDRVVIEKELNDSGVTVNPTNVIVTLSQQDTLALSPGAVQIQIRAKFADSSVVASDIITTKAEQILKEGEI